MTRIAVPVHRVPRLHLLPPLPGEGETLILLLALAPGVGPGHGPLKDNHSGTKTDDCTGIKQTVLILVKTANNIHTCLN